VKDGFDAGAGSANGVGIIKRGGDEAHAACFEFGRRLAGEDSHVATGGEQALDNPAAEEAGAAGDERWGV
jgi:hypothetical protein